jgi:hypothetical protein
MSRRIELNQRPGPTAKFRLICSSIAADAGPERMRTWSISGNERLARIASVVVSFVLGLGIVSAGWLVLPGPAAGNAERLYEGPSPAEATSAPQLLPVFVMRPDHSVIRHGVAIWQSNGVFTVRVFPSTEYDEPLASDALLFEPSMAVLWAAATDSSREELKRRLNALQEEAAKAIETVITSDVFTNSYRPVLRASLTEVVSRAWEDPETQTAVEELLLSSDAEFKRVVQGDLKAIVVGRINDAVWQMLEANWLNALGMPFGYELDYTPVLEAVTATLVDPRFQKSFIAFGSERLGTEEARRLAERIAIGVADALMRDQRVPKIVNQMFWDPQLRRLLDPFMEAVASLIGALPRHLGGLGSESSLNPLAAHIFKAMALGERTPLILLVTPEDRDRIERLESDAATFLKPVATADGG